MESSQRFNDVYIGFRKLSSLELVYPLLKSHVERFRTLNLKDWTEETLNEALHVLSSCILSPECADSILECFPRVASNIVTLALEKGIEDHQTRYVVLGKLFQSCNTVVQQFLNYFDEANPPWKSPETKSAKSPKKRKMSVRRITDLEAVECCWNLLRSDFNTFRSRWNWNGFLDKFLSSENQQVVWVACQCVAKVFLMDESTKRDFMLRLLPQSKILEYELHYDISPSSRSWLNSSHPTDTSGDFSSRVPPLTTHLYANIDGVLLPIFHKQHVNNNKLVPVKSTMSNLQRIAIGVSTNKALGLMGPVGCGKSALVEYLASLTGRRTDIELLQVQLGEETDSKLLLGTYKCTDVPGEFIWESGILTKAVMGGHWLLMEDIESAASDVVAVLSNLLEHNTINVPGYRDNVRAAPGFHLFMTHRLLPGGQGHHRKHSTATELLEKHWLLVNVEPLTTDELIHIIQVKFPLLKTIASRMVAVYLLLADGEHDSTSGSSRAKFGQRLISTRDLLKWCTRAEIGFDVTSPESGLKVLQDAIDIFCCCYSDLASRSKIAGEMAARLGIVKTKAEYFCNLYKPSIVFNTKSCIAGRVNLPRLESDGPVSLDCITTDLKFALTRESSCLLERLAVCLSLNEPALIVGETGTGKTTTIQLLAKHTGHKLVVINMNQQSDSSDLLGGYKPVDLKQTVLPLREEFEVLFRSLFNVQSNQTFLENISACVSKRMWSTLLKMMAQSQTAAVKRLGAGKKSAQALAKWRELGDEINRLQVQLSVNQSAMAFSFIEGSLVKALKEGHWVLLDEINLACAETLQCLSGLLEGPTGSIFLLERGDAVKVSRHPNFRLLAAMNPATDFGKKDLPAGVRNRFTELFVSEHSEVNDLSLVVKCYLPDLPPQKVGAVVRFYLLVRKKAAEVLIDSTGHRPIYSLRTLCRGLLVAAENKCGNMNRSLYEALCLSFLTQLNASSHTLVKDMIAALVLDRDIIKSTLSQPITEPLTGRHICFEGYWVEKGPSTPSIDEKYLLTPSVKKNLCDIARCVSLSNHPLLIQGETSVGKTSLITYLANAAGHKCYRINNHQHTDLQEYVGTYSADPVTGTLVFREGVLVEAMKAGHWIILDELNLAPSEVLEALNRVLDDNRELFITETQETVKAHPSFRLFATQNPPGLYGGRKMLSRAFRNRFVELHFGEIPAPELETILQHRCNMPLSYCKKLVAVMADLQIRRKGSATFAGKLGFITLRDLFRWGERYRLAQASDPGKYYDWDQHIADEGYLVLAGRVRKNEERETIRDVLEKKMKRKVDIEKLFTLNNDTSSVTRHILEKIVAPPLPEGFNHIVWTYNLRKTAVLVGKALEFCEPLLLVGETGCGKTTICQLLAVIQVQLLYSVNCHQHSESSDFLGGLRPVRDKTEPGGKLFEWVDGPLIRAMKEGMMFLVDEISLADDSVLERLNSLLEPERKLMVSEKGSDDDVDITAADDFRFVGTMNPGGDFGKKELSPALRNRLTEIWCEGPTSDVDMMAIVEHNVRAGLSLGNQEDNSTGIGKALVSFLKWFNTTEIGKRIGVSVRDVLTWIRFINLMASDLDDEGSIDVATAYVHGACLTLLDGIGTATTAMDNVDALKTFRTSCVDFLLRQVDLALGSQHSPALDVLLKPESVALQVISTSEKFGIHPFYITKVPGIEIKAVDFTFEAPTTCLNTLRLIRSLQIPSRAILLEGSPGVGKTSIVAALAKATGHEVTRINLSEQTDISDLFGADLPVEGAAGGTFAWRDGPFLKALKQGHWILLDELNLASQSVVEGLNSVLDHRGEVFVPELGRTFHIQTKATRLFACQNPQRQGGQRKGLPQSFLNRFTQVFVEPLSKEDLIVIAKGSHPSVDPEILEKMVELTIELNDKTKAGSWGSYGGPYEWNLRDLNFWIESFSALRGRQMPGAFVKTIYADRLRKPSERQDVLDEYGRIFGPKYPIVNSTAPLIMDPSKLLLGELVLSRSTPSHEKESVVDLNSSHLVLRHQLPTLRSLALCVQMGWLAILVGDSYCGKTGVLNTLAQLVGKRLYTIPVSSAMDTTELLGGFEQTDYGRHLDALHKKIHRIIIRISRLHISKGSLDTAQRLLEIWQAANLSTDQDMEEYFTLEKALVIMKKRIDGLLKVLSCLVNTEGVLSEDQIGTKIESLESLKRTVEVQGAKAGGNFEWVDSVLVKCLEQGHWLVVDHVNLCSGAVLDRLNGLLEPDGVLVMSERGVGADGTEVVVKPHKDFRIFFTLDPNYGHISRAMRNRGIEIYMERLPSVLDGPAGYDDFSKFSSELDLMGLLQDAGFTSSAHSQALIHIHSKLALHCYGYETPHVGHLMDAAFLTLQNWKKGQPLTTVVEAAFTDVYLKSRTISVEQKLKLTNALSEAISSANRELASESSSFMDCFGKSIALRTLCLDESSVFQCLKHQGSLLQASIELFKTVATSESLSKNLSSYTLSDFEALSDSVMGCDHRVLDTLPFVVMAFYGFASAGDVDLRHAWIENLTTGPVNTITRQIYDKILLLSSVVRDVIKSGHPPSTLPWDPRHLSPLADWNCSLQNRLHAHICYRILRACDDDESTSIGQKIEWKSLSIMQYSRAVKKGMISDLPTNSSVVTEISVLFDLLENVIVRAFNSSQTELSLENCWDWLNRVAWKFRLWNMTKRRLFSIQQARSDSLPPVNFESLTYLVQHYKWFRKHTLPMLVDIASHDHALENEVNTLMALIDTIDQSVDLGKIHMIPLCRKMIKSVEPPSPMKTTEQCDLSKKIHRIEDGLEYWKPDILSVETLVQEAGFLASTTGQKTRRKYVECCKIVINNENVGEGGLFAEEIENSFKTINTVAAGDRECGIIKMWPFLEYVALLLNSAVRSACTEACSASVEPNNKRLTELVGLSADWFLATESIPPSAVGALKSCMSSQNVECVSTMFLHLAAHLNSSSAIRRPFLLLEWDGKPVAEDETLAVLDVCQQDPMLAAFLGCLVHDLFQTSAAGSLLALTSHRNTLRVVHTLKTLLWRNLPAIASPILKPSINEAAYLKNSYRRLINDLRENLGINETVPSTVEEIRQALEALNFDSGKVKGQSCISFITPVIDNLKSLEEMMRSLDSFPEDSWEWWICTGKSWASLGYVCLMFYSNLELIDPVHKEAMKRLYGLEELKELKLLLSVQELTRAIVGATGTWPLRDQYRSRITELESKKELQEGVAVRPYPSLYNKISMELKSFMDSLFTHEKFKDIVSRLSNGNLSSDVSTRICTEVNSWLKSVKSFYYRLKSQYYACYPDIVTPALLALSQVIWGVETALSNMSKISARNTTRGEPSLHKIVAQLASVTDIRSSVELIDSCCSSRLVNLLKKADEMSHKKPRASYDKTSLSKVCMRLVKALRTTYIENTTQEYIFRVLEYIVDSWEKLQEENRIKIAQEKSIYINKLTPIQIEEEEMKNEILELFPVTRDDDFGDLEGPENLEDVGKPAKTLEEKESKKIAMSIVDVEEICEIHRDIVRCAVRTPWLVEGDGVTESPLNPSLLKDRMELFWKLMSKNGFKACESSLNLETVPVLLVALSQPFDDSLSNLDVESPVDASTLDFYHDPNVSEATQCVSLLHATSTRVGELLAEWPDHPTLKLINEIILRISGFSITSPISRFLSGLELLLTRLHEWEENAHDSVSLARHAASVTNQIIAWRRLELTAWKGALNSKKRAVAKGARRWWFHLYSLTVSFLRQSYKTDELVSALQTFMEASSLGEFETRLQLLLTFHCHSLILPFSDCQRTLNFVFWNTYRFYRQFAGQVSTKIVDLGNMIEKKLKEFVKIARWNDINYWAVKAAVEKTHKTVHKHIKEYEKMLQEPASCAMTRLASGPAQLKLPSINFVNYLTCYKPLETYKEGESEDTETHILRLESLLRKCRRNCKEIIVRCSYPKLLNTMNVYLQEWREVGDIITQFEIDPNTPEEKKRATAKVLLQRKRRTVADLLKTLAQLGLSYRSGLLMYEQSNTDFALIPPLDVKVALTQLSSRSCDPDLVSSWKDTEDLFLSAVAQYAQLKRHLNHPHKDLGPVTVEKVKGFTASLTNLARETKESLCSNATELYSIRCILFQLTQVSENNVQGIDHSACRSNEVNIMNCLDDVIFTLKQFSSILNACPAQENFVDFKELTIFPPTQNQPLVNAHKSDQNWNRVKSLIDSTVKMATKLKEELRKWNSHQELAEKSHLQVADGVDVVINDVRAKKTTNCIARLKNTADTLRSVIDLFSSEIDGVKCSNPLSSCVEVLVEQLSNLESVCTSAELPKDIKDEEIVSNFTGKVNRLVHKVLIAVQNLYKIHVPSKIDAPTEQNGTNNEEEASGLEDGHLKEKLVGSIATDFRDFRISDISNDLKQILLQLKEVNTSGSYIECLSVLRNAFPLLDQLSCLYQFFVVQQTSTLKIISKTNALLLGVFTEFAKNGYNVPDDLREEGEEGESEGTKGGMGLGEGEGEKDVSDQIESLDQLEDAKRPEDYKNQKEEQKDCKEEEKGIDMEEDIDGELQDIDKKPDDEEGEEDGDDKEDPDKEMGDTEKGAEALDKEVWGSDSEEEDNDDLSDDEGNRGSEQTEKELGAKTGDDEDGRQDDKDDKRQHDQKKPEINEMEEPEVDDDHVDPYHGNQPPTPEVEPLDIPENLDMDGDDSDEDQDKEGEEENPFDIDKMKEQNALDANPEEGQDEKDDDENGEDDSNRPPDDIVDDDEDDGKDFDKPDMIQDEPDETEPDEQPEEDQEKEPEGLQEVAETEELEKEEEASGDAPQADKPSDAQAEASEDQKESSDQVASKDDVVDEKSTQKSDTQNDDGKEEDGGAGVTEPDETNEGGRRGAAGKQQRNKSDKQQEDQKRQRPGDSNIERSLGEVNEPAKKKLKTIEAGKEQDDEEREQEDDAMEQDDDADLYQHIKEAQPKAHDTQVIDAATKEQAAEQKPVINKEDEKADPLKAEDDITEMDEDENDITEVDAPMPKSDSKEEREKNEKGPKGKKEGTVMEDANIEVEIEGELVQTLGAARAPDSTYHTQADQLIADDQFELLTSEDVFRLRQELQEQLASWNQPPANEEASEAWEKLCSVTSGLSRDLCEQLRLVLEPTTASGLKGDFRTGRRINMRKVIPYIASQFRKDKIWLRRSKPSKREYQVVMAIDDSSSMADNQSKELAFESLALVSRALTLLEAGDLAVLSFGESVKVLHELGQPFTDHSGTRLVQQLTFDQKRTKVGALVDFTTALLASCAKKTDADVAQLLVILSDGRGVMSEGEAQMLSAVRNAKHNRVFMIFVIIENPNSKDSILDIRQPCFKDGRLLGITSYMDNFPFPFYLILRDIASLPSVLSDALRQWFELVATSQ